MNQLFKQNSSAFYTFDITTLKNRITYLQDYLPKNVDLCYAVKANTFIIKEIIDNVKRFEVCSPGEANICKKLGVPSNQMVISGVYKTPNIMEQMVCSTNDQIYTIESLTQLKLFETLSNKYKKQIPLLLRLTNGSQFGINEDEIIQIIANRNQYQYLQILGIQFFSGTQKTSIKKLKREIERLDGLLYRLKEEYYFDAKELEYGPGFPTAYFKDDHFLEEEFLAEFSSLINHMNYKGKIILELGRSIAATCGKYYTHVVDKKCNKKQNYLLVDGGMHHLVYFGQHMAMKQPFLSVCGKELEPIKDTWNICGSLCSMNDFIAKQVSLPDIEIGDIICFENTGAYCMSEGISLFLSRELPAIYLIKDNQEVICVRESFESSQLNIPERRKS